MDETKLRMVEDLSKETGEKTEEPEDLFMHRVLRAMESGDRHEIMRSAVGMIQHGLSLTRRGESERREGFYKIMHDTLDIMSLECLMKHFPDNDKAKYLAGKIKERVLRQIEVREIFLDELEKKT